MHITSHSLHLNPNLHKMAGSHESNQNIEIASASKKSKSGKSGRHSKSGKSGQVHEHSGQSGHQQEHSKKKGKKRVQFREESPSKRQRVEEDDPLVYRDGPLEAVSGQLDRKSTRLNSSHSGESRMPSSA